MMKKLTVICLIFACVVSLVACSAKNTESGKMQEHTDGTIASINATTTGITETTAMTTPIVTIDQDAAIKAELIAKYGLPFCLRRTEGMALWKFSIGENNASREYHHSMEGSFSQELLSWEIVNGELVITGEWNETFTLDMEANKAISKTDGAIYRIIKEQE